MKNNKYSAFISIFCFTVFIIQILPAYSGGFAIREQSASGLGTAYSGIAVGKDLSTMYWNPAGTANLKGMNTESHISVGVFDNTMTANEATLQTQNGSVDLLASPFVTEDSGQYADTAVVGATYFNYHLQQIDPNLYIGMAINSPFGLVTKPDNLGGDTQWAGAFQGTTSELFTFNFNPQVAYKITPQFTVGVGVQIQYIETTLKFATPTEFGSVGPNATFRGDDIGAGVTAGFIWEPKKGSRLGFGYRSSIEHELDSTFQLPASLLPQGVPDKVSTTADVELPDMFIVSARHAVTPKLNLLATFEYTKWSDLDQIEVAFDNVNNVGGPLILDFGWDDGWFLSGGVEYQYDEKLQLRAGGGFERSPIQDATQRVVQVPDADRIWLSVGGTYKFSETTSFDIGYTHIFVEDGDIDRVAALAPITLKGEAEADADIIAFSFKRKLGAAVEPLPPLK